MEAENRFSIDIMRILRQRLGLDEDDTSRDAEINTYSMDSAFQEVLAWEGFFGYFGAIKGWIEDIYGVNLTEICSKEYAERFMQLNK